MYNSFVLLFEYVDCLCIDVYSNNVLLYFCRPLQRQFRCLLCLIDTIELYHSP